MTYKHVLAIPEYFGISWQINESCYIKNIHDGFYLVTSDDAQPMLVLIGNEEKTDD